MNFLTTLDKSNLLILISIFLVVIPLSSVISWYALIKFKKSKDEIKFANKPLIISMLVIQIISIITSVLSLLTYQGILIPIDSDSRQNAQILLIVFLVISVVLCAIWFIFIIFFSNLLLFYVNKSEGKLITLGESINLTKIEKIIDDEAKSAIYVNYLEGKKTLKKIKFSKKTTIGLYFLESVPAMGFEVEKASEEEYFKNEVVKIRKAALEEHQKRVNSISKASEKLDEQDKTVDQDLQNDQNETVDQVEQSETVDQNDQNETVDQNEQSETVDQNEQSEQKDSEEKTDNQ